MITTKEYCEDRHWDASEPPALEEAERRIPDLLEERKRPTLIFVSAEAV